MERQDIILDNLGDLTFFNGDFLVNTSDQQHAEHIIKANKGQFYQFPLLGVGIINYNKANINVLTLENEIKINLKSDKYRPKLVRVSEDFKIYVTAEPLEI